MRAGREGISGIAVFAGITRIAGDLRARIELRGGLCGSPAEVLMRLYTTIYVFSYCYTSSRCMRGRMLTYAALTYADVC